MAREVYTGFGFKGYRPDTSEVFNKLEGRRTRPFIRGMDVNSERRWAARFVSQTDLTITEMVAQIHARGPKIKEMLTAWGIDWRERRMLSDEEWQMRLEEERSAAAAPPSIPAQAVLEVCQNPRANLRKEARPLSKAA